MLQVPGQRANELYSKRTAGLSGAKVKPGSASCSHPVVCIAFDCFWLLSSLHLLTLLLRLTPAIILSGSCDTCSNSKSVKDVDFIEQQQKTIFPSSSPTTGQADLPKMPRSSVSFTQTHSGQLDETVRCPTDQTQHTWNVPSLRHRAAIPIVSGKA